jgi:hypothetical protein
MQELQTLYFCTLFGGILSRLQDPKSMEIQAHGKSRYESVRPAGMEPHWQ